MFRDWMFSFSIRNPRFPSYRKSTNKKVARKTTGGPTAQGRYCLGLLPFGPDPVHSRPLHRTRPSSATTLRRECIRFFTGGEVARGHARPRSLLPLPEIHDPLIRVVLRVDVLNFDPLDRR